MKKPVPHLWFKEVAEELARKYMDARTRPAFQQKRIDAVLALGKDHEVMKNGNIIPLTELYEFLENAKEEANKAEQYKQDLMNFRAKYRPEKLLKGNIEAAKLAAQLAYLKGTETDFQFKLLHKLMDKYKLSDKQTTTLMNHFEKIGIKI